MKYQRLIQQKKKERFLENPHGNSFLENKFSSFQLTYPLERLAQVRGYAYQQHPLIKKKKPTDPTPRVKERLGAGE